MNLAERELGINNPIKYLPRLPDDRKDPQPLIDDGTNHPGSTSRRQRGIVVELRGDLLYRDVRLASQASLIAAPWTTYFEFTSKARKARYGTSSLGEWRRSVDIGTGETVKR